MSWGNTNTTTEKKCENCKCLIYSCVKFCRACDEKLGYDELKKEFKKGYEENDKQN